MKDTSIRCTKENAAPDDRASLASSPAPLSTGYATSPSPTAEEGQRTVEIQRTPSGDAQSRLKSNDPEALVVGVLEPLRPLRAR